VSISAGLEKRRSDKRLFEKKHLLALSLLLYRIRNATVKVCQYYCLLGSRLQARMASRVFVRGLPPNISEDEFKKHFSAICTITDAKLIPHRRIGYVGYQSEGEAVRAIKHFNRSFIRLSRIGVELARPVTILNGIYRGVTNKVSCVGLTCFSLNLDKAAKRGSA
jgi:hypothetical protein